MLTYIFLSPPSNSYIAMLPYVMYSPENRRRCSASCESLCKDRFVGASLKTESFVRLYIEQKINITGSCIMFGVAAKFCCCCCF